MPTQEDVRRIVSALPGAIESSESFGFGVLVKGKHKGFLWEWLERVDPKKARVRNPGVLAIVVPNLQAKEMLLNADIPGVFTEPHYNGYPAILIRLNEVPMSDLEDMVIEAYRAKAPKSLTQD